MRRNKGFIRGEEGQSIIIIAAAMIGLLALAGLAIDGGNVYLQRRNAQNAADAAALAGTRQLARAICGEGATDAEVAYAVAEFAERNGVEESDSVSAVYVDLDETVLGQVGAGTIPIGATGVAAEIVNHISTYFIRVVGFAEVDVAARATAVTGPPLNAGGLRPIGMPIELILELDPGDPFRINFGNCDQKPEECLVSYTGGQVQHRGWLNLAYVWNDGRAVDEDPDWPRAIDPSGDANVLKEWMESGYPGPPLWHGDYIHAKPGTNSSVIGEAPVGETILIPIFHEVPHYDDIPGDDDIQRAKPDPASQGGGYYYHIDGFMAFKVTGKNQGGGWLEGEFVHAYLGMGQVGDGEELGYGERNA
jgi:hypothetical protein